jgi:hypothetical protein
MYKNFENQDWNKFVINRKNMGVSMVNHSIYKYILHNF